MPALLLAVVAVIWGGGFIWTQVALDYGFSPGLILACRFAVASAVFLVFCRKKIFPISKDELKRGAALGLLLFLGFYVQTTGLRFTTPSNNGFFTAVNVIIVPLIAWRLNRRSPPAKLWGCCAIALSGFFILSWRPGTGFSVNSGDMLTLLSAFFFACHIAGLGVLSKTMNPLKATFIQMSTAGVLSLGGMLIFEGGALSRADFAAGGVSVILLGLLSTCFCFFIQTWAQARTGPGKAALIMAGESLWCMIFSVMAGYEILTLRMAGGGLLVVGATVLLELEPPRSPVKSLAESEETV
jgi:drug/metabolite transporter (DMT)-like permease